MLVGARYIVHLSTKPVVSGFKLANLESHFPNRHCTDCFLSKAIICVHVLHIMFQYEIVRTSGLVYLFVSL